ncbi:MAG: response regulator transcription factor [Rhodothermales bacterium]
MNRGGDRTECGRLGVYFRTQHIDIRAKTPQNQVLCEPVFHETLPHRYPHPTHARSRADRCSDRRRFRSLRNRLRRLLESLDFAVVRGETISADGVIQLIDSDDHFDVAILDIQMPGSGIKALKHIRQHHPAVKVVILTNHADPFYYKVCMQAGATCFLDKSMEFDQLPGVLKALSTDS